MRAAVSLAALLMAAGCSALLAAGCTVLLAAGCTVPAEEPTPVLRTSSQLPEAERQLLEAWRSRGSDWPLAREQALEDPRLASFLVDNALLDLIRAWQRGEFTFTEAGGYEEVRAEVLALGAAAAPSVAALLGLGNGYGPAIASDVLLRLGPAGARALLAEVAPDRSALVRGQAFDLLGGFAPLGADLEAQVRTAAIDALARDTVRRATSRVTEPLQQLPRLLPAVPPPAALRRAAEALVPRLSADEELVLVRLPTALAAALRSDSATGSGTAAAEIPSSFTAEFAALRVAAEPAVRAALLEVLRRALVDEDPASREAVDAVAS